MFLDAGQVELEEEVSEAEHGHSADLMHQSVRFNFGWLPLNYVAYSSLP